MATDPKDPKPPIPSVPRRPGTTPLGVPSIQERGGRQGDHRHYPRPGSHASARAEALPAFITEEITKNYVDEDRRREARATRPTEQRLERLEDFKDDMSDFKTEIASRMGKVEVAVADMGGQFKVIPLMVEQLNKATETLKSRDHFVVTTRTEVDKAQAIGDVEVGTAEKVTAAEVKATEAEVRKAKWNLLLKIGGIVTAIWTTVSTVLLAQGC